VRSSLKADVRASVALSIHNLTMALAASEGVLHLKLVHEVFFFSSLELSDTHVYEPKIRALLGTTRYEEGTLKGFEDFYRKAKAII